MQDARAAAFRVRRACAMLSKSKGNVWAMCARSVYCEVAAVVRCLSMRSKYVIGKSTYKFLPYTGVGERQRVRRSSRATRAQSARSPVLGSRRGIRRPGCISLLRSFSVSDRIQASPRHRGFRAALGSRKRETLPRPSMRIRMRGPRFAVAAGSWHVLAAARAGERVRVGEGTERGNNKTRSGPLRAGPVSPGTFAFSRFNERRSRSGGRRRRCGV